MAGKALLADEGARAQTRECHPQPFARVFSQFAALCRRHIHKIGLTRFA